MKIWGSEWTGRCTAARYWSIGIRSWWWSGPLKSRLIGKRRWTVLSLGLEDQWKNTQFEWFWGCVPVEWTSRIIEQNSTLDRQSLHGVRRRWALHCCNGAGCYVLRGMGWYIHWTCGVLPVIESVFVFGETHSVFQPRNHHLCLRTSCSLPPAPILFQSLHDTCMYDNNSPQYNCHWYNQVLLLYIDLYFKFIWWVSV